ncbi:uncharacterized protein KGF55_003036 [Candida pseudojiufengensis]|uniref:uncharacterized protein n=1 Tax=Candida pseudojiufengensis TaxID=497109 RepID=UPI0022247714|nr:uncharacterized protein KGF55_003036 [Candida pseudojiufengensis]KAI5963244.1 hypothetical protein KGF55_003036 [Candida pseudojiufengensis]
MSDIKKRKTYSSVNVDYKLIDQLNKVLETNDTQNLIQFIEYGNLGKILPIWSYYSSSNNHKEFVEITNKLNNILFMINESKDLFLSQRQIIIDTSKDILINYLKIIYRALSSLKPSSTNPTIRLLNHLVSYDYVICMEFMNQFDLSLPVLPKLLIPTKIEIENEINDNYSIRSNFLKFWINLCSNLNYINRLDLLLNFKITRNIWKYIEYDTLSTLENLIQFLNNRVLDEINFKKAQKCKILNDNFMFKVQTLLTKIKEPFFMEFMIKLTTDYKNGIVFPNDEIWFENSNIGVEIDINNKTFKIANKLIYTLLTSLKPTNSNKEIQFITKIIGSCQELIPPYMNYLVQHGGGYNDPSLTSWWISHVLLYSNILQLQLPKFDINLEFTKFDPKLITESIVFAPLSKNVLVAGLNSDKGLIVQLTLQLIMYILIKLENILQIVNIRQELLYTVFNLLPELSSYVQLLSKHNSSKLIKLTALTIINKYESLKPNSTNQISLQKLISNGVSNIVSKTEINQYDLSILDIYMNLQNQDFKWWNKLNNSNSFFTTLIKLSSNSNLSKNYIIKIYNLINKLSQDKMLFNENLLITPILSLIYSINSSSMSTKFWNMIDETISRCIRTPYKYLDISHLKYNDLSIFIITLLEQFKFIEQNDENLEWLGRFFKFLIIFGNNEKDLRNLFQNINLDSTNISSNLDDNSILEIAFNYENKELNLSKLLKDKIITSNTEFLSILYLLNQTNSLNDIIFPIIYNYLINSDARVQNYFASKLVWENIIFDVSKREYYNEILQNLSNVDTDSLAEFVCENLKNGSAEYHEFLWTLKDEQVQSLSNVEDDAILSEFVKRKLSVNFDQFYCALSNDKLASQIIDSNLISLSEDQLNQILNEIVSNKDFRILPNLINKYFNIANKLLDKNIEDDELNILLASSIIQQNLELPTNFLNSVISIIEKQLHENIVSNWNQILVILSLQENKHIEQVLKLIEFKQTLNPIFIDYISKIPQEKELIIWLHKSILYITKSFAELKVFSTNFDEFLKNFGDYLLNSKIWDLIPSNVLNTQIEVILNSNFINNDDSIYLKYLIKILVIAPKRKIEFQKLFQISLISLKSLNDIPTSKNQIQKRYFESFILYILFNFDHSKLSNLNNMEILLEKYQGLNNIDDQLISQILKIMESKISISWIKKVSNWEFSELKPNNELFEMDKLILKKNNEFIVTLNKYIIENSFNIKEFSLPKLNQGLELWEQIESLEYHQESFELTYNYEFLIMIILNNEEILKFKKLEDGSIASVFNIKNLIDTGILQFIISNISNNQYQQITNIILNKILVSLDDELNQFFKDKNIFKIYLSTICFTLQQDYKISNLIWFIYSQFIPILSNPGHFLYEKTCRYILSHPKLNKIEIPLYNSIFKAIDTEFYYRELIWLIENITEGINSKENLNLLNSYFIESILNLLNSKFINIKLKSSILKFIYKLQSIDHGSDLLITRFGILCDLSLLSNEFVVKDDAKDKDKEDTIFNNQLKLNFNEIISRFGVSNSKRIENWSNGDFKDNLKRLHSYISN